MEGIAVIVMGSRIHHLINVSAQKILSWRKTQRRGQPSSNGILAAQVIDKFGLSPVTVELLGSDADCVYCSGAEHCSDTLKRQKMGWPGPGEGHVNLPDCVVRCRGHVPICVLSDRHYSCCDQSCYAIGE